MPQSAARSGAVAAPGVLGPGDLVLVRALVGLRLVALVPPVVALVVRRERLDRPALGLVLLATVAGYTAWAAWRARQRAPVGRAGLAVEVLLASALLAADGWVFGADATFTMPALGALWPLAAVMSVGMYAGPTPGAGAGVGVALSRLFGALAPEVERFGDVLGDFINARADGPPRLVPMLSMVALYAVAGLGVGYLRRLQQRAERDIASARAREEVARTLHDGVLQTLAILSRRSPDPELARLARDTDRDLRAFLAGSVDGAAGGLEARLRAAGDAFARRFDVACQVLVDDTDTPAPSPEVLDAVVGAVGEALTNAGKHASPTRVVIYAGRDEHSGERLVTILDNGCGFDPHATPAGRGLGRSVHARIAEIGGRVEIRSAPGAGTEVRLWMP